MKHTKKAIREQRPIWAFLLALIVLMVISHETRNTVENYLEIEESEVN